MDPTALDRSVLRERVAEVVARRPEIAAAWWFGSVPAGRAREDSDLDVGVVFSTSCPRETIDTVLTDLAADLAVKTGIEPVDVVDLVAQGPIFCLHVLTSGERIAENDPERRIDFETYTMSRAHDFQPTYDIMTRGKIGALRRWLRTRYDLPGDPIQAGRAEVEPGEPRSDSPRVARRVPR